MLFPYRREEVSKAPSPSSLYVKFDMICIHHVVDLDKTSRGRYFGNLHPCHSSGQVSSLTKYVLTRAHL
jgi:hypothetical protein